MIVTINFEIFIRYTVNDKGENFRGFRGFLVAKPQKFPC